MQDNSKFNIEQNNLEQIVPEMCIDKKTVYVLDDDRDDRFFSKMHLMQSRWVEDVKSFSQAVELFDYFEQTGIYDGDMMGRDNSILLLDVHMPSINGMEVLDYIRTHPVTTDMTVILLTSDLSPESIYEAYRLQATGYLNKPFSIKNFEELLAREKNQFSL